MSYFLERLRKYRENRGVMANLRCILVESKMHRAWPALHRIGIKIDDEVMAHIAGLYATHPEEDVSKNFGVTCKSIERKRGDKRNDEIKLTPTERRFQYLLTAKRGKELNDRVMRMVFMAKSQGVPVNYEKLSSDMKYWNNQKKIEWATEFWTKGEAPTEEGE